MVAPLALLAVVWDRRRWDTARLVNRRLRLRLGPWRRELPLGTAVAGFLLAAMGLLTLGLAASGPGMSSGWQARLAGWLDHMRAVALDALEWLPGALTTGLVFAALVAVLVLAWRQRRARHRHVRISCRPACRDDRCGVPPMSQPRTKPHTGPATASAKDQRRGRATAARRQAAQARQPPGHAGEHDGVEDYYRG